MDQRSVRALKYYNDFLAADDAGNLPLAQEALRRSARLGEPMAYHAMAYAEFGKDSPRIQLALEKYRKAAKAGFGPSAWNLALYYKKIGRQGLFEKWMRCAAKAGDPFAEEELDLR